MVWCRENRLIIHFSKAYIPPSIHSYIHLFLQIILVQNRYCSTARNGINSVAQPAATTFAISSVFILLRFLDWRVVTGEERMLAEGRRLEFSAQLLSDRLDHTDVAMDALGI